ncbi:MAG: efflux RND transporter periplasmic adaptor subunit [Clostridia bacterium]|nr:efflux RND transporter periplasmic adaptor subunit [Clostridia bacterium]
MNRSRKIKIGIAAGIIVILAVAMMMTKGGKKSKGGMPLGQETSVTVVKAEHPSSGDIILTTGLTGTVEPSDVVHIYAKAAGDVTAVYVKAGDMVTQGQVLFEIDTEQVETAKNSMDAASVSLSEAQSNLRRMQILYSGGDLSEQEYEQYVNGVKSAQLQYESAKLAYERQVQYSTVTVPINGKIESFDVEVYDRVSQSQDLCVIAGEGENIVSFYVTQRMMQNANVGDQLEIQKNGTTYKANISEINSMVDTDTGLFKVKAQIENTQEIAPGSTVKLNLVTERALDTMVVPIDAIYYSGGNAYVYLYQDGAASMAQVEVGLEDEEHAQILSGLTADDMVVSTWSSNLYEGAKIRLRDEVQSGEKAQPGEAVQSGEELQPGETAPSGGENSEHAESQAEQEA